MVHTKRANKGKLDKGAVGMEKEIKALEHLKQLLDSGDYIINITAVVTVNRANRLYANSETTSINIGDITEIVGNNLSLKLDNSYNLVETEIPNYIELESKEYNIRVTLIAVKKPTY